MAWYTYDPHPRQRRFRLARDSYLDEGLLYQRWNQDVAPEAYIYPTLYRNLMWNYYRYNPKRYNYWWWRGGDTYRYP